eukprot:TRINITY_DN7539_c0_g1_i12.p1 TRINITY_DN7539_c0_g1~~TRINITY_DN7539_c0_g1_i12.p1  ORF type:complete len:220 (+),score=39.06 TRINITY_DN7539_c0_g1_i12:695-1354(+)
MSYAEIGPVLCRQKIVTVVQEYLKKLDATFTVSSAGTEKKETKSLTILLNKEKIKLRADRETFSKAPYNKHLKVELDGSSAFQIAVKVSDQEKRFEFICRNSLERDVLALTVRLFNLLQMMGKARPADNMVALIEWIRHTNISEEVGVVDSKRFRKLQNGSHRGSNAFGEIGGPGRAGRSQSISTNASSPGIPRSEERFSRNAETDLVCRLLLEKKKML